MDGQPRFYAEAASENRRVHRATGVWKDPDFAGDFDWEVLDREAIASRHVLCRATRARAVMIAEALNAAVPASDPPGMQITVPPRGNAETDREFKNRLGDALVFVSDQMAGEDLDRWAVIHGMVRK